MLRELDLSQRLHAGVIAGIKPDYCNANGLEMWDESLTDEDLSEVGLTDRWVDWYSECQCYDDPRKYLESLKEETSAA
ncbi:superinfection exclusion protein [Escherichia coli]|nr:superinfection exclusion protein [Escherichia coli]EJO4596016.1 superinfection exclusion protein [Escherichia coli]